MSQGRVHEGSVGGHVPPARSAPVWRPEDLSPAWLSDVLREAGALEGGAIEDFTVEPVGTGQMGDSFRLRLHTGSRAASPRSIVGKFTAADEQSRATGVSMRTAEVEVRFYQQVARSLSARIAHCHYADVDPTTARFVLLLEDLAPLCPGDQIQGCTLDQAAAALEQLAKVHAPRWADPTLEQVGWLNRRTEADDAALAGIFPLLYDGFVERYGERLPEAVTAVGSVLFPRLGGYFGRRPGPLTVQHADYRVDNLLFGGDGGRSVAIVDWQTVTLGPGASDVAYFLGGSIEVEDRRAHETELLRHYLDVLQAEGGDRVAGYGWDALWEDYRRHTFAGLIMAVGAAMMVARTDRGDEMFMAMARRAATHAEDLESLTLLPDD